ncbi:hypothetical protein SB847_21405, partial [Bacillus sp. SIMBA_026]
VKPHVALSDNTDIQAVEQLAMMPLTKGNSTQLLIDGDATFASLFAGIERAQDYLLIQFFIVRDDELGRQLHQHLIAAVKRGVRVY